MNRRDFLVSGTLAAAGATLAPRAQVMTVRGPIDSGRLGLTLMHEHVLVDFIGADRVSRERYRSDEVFRVALPHLKRAAALGCRTLVECTPAYLGRDPALLKRLSSAAGLQIVTNTGYYGANRDLHVPAHAYQESPEQLAARWAAEFERGIEGTGVKPGIIKIGVDAGPLSEIDAKLVRAAALAHLKTGLTIGAHTGDGRAALAQLDVLAAAGVGPQAFIWIHAQSEKDTAMHREAAARGCWVEFDGVSRERTARHVELVTGLAVAGHLDRTLVSMDAGWYHVGEPGGGDYRGYVSLFEDFLPALRTQFNSAQLEQLLRGNPARALALEVRRARAN
ncbi:MAG TPA: phosphotriesterase [Blastocatellia bacterium]|nr:phosphotriesterase [Blastocatellia bacterium]